MIINEKLKHEQTCAQGPIPCITIFWAFFRIGLFTPGGGLAMSMVIRHELVIKRRWIQDADFISLMSLATAVPGAIAVNIAYLLGRRLGARQGSAVAILGTVMPSFFVMLFIAGILGPFFDYPRVAAFFRGCSIAIAGQLAFTGFIFARRLLRRWQHLIVCAAGVMAIGVLKMHPVWGLIIASVLGYWLYPGKQTAGRDAGGLS
jgi:chromate transporter